MIPASYQAKKKFMELAIAEAKRAGDRGDYPIGAVITRVSGKSETIIASAGNRVKTSGSSIKHVELEMLKYVCSGYGRYLILCFIPPTNPAPCAPGRACGQRLARLSTAFPRRTLTPTDASTATKSTNGVPVSSLAGLSSKRAVTTSPWSAASSAGNAKSCSVTELRSAPRPRHELAIGRETS